MPTQTSPTTSRGGSRSRQRRRRSFSTFTQNRSTDQRRGNFSRGPRGGGSRDGRRSGPPRGSGGRGGNRRPQKQFDVSQYINRQPVDLAPEPTYEPTHRFADFALSRELKANLEQLGLTTPTPIQDQIIPQVLEGRDAIGLAATGTGKTAAFLLPLIERHRARRSEQVLILTPTRELAIQIEKEFEKLARGLRLHAATCVGGTNIRPQLQALRRTPTFIVGTPGRVMDLIDRGAIRPEQIRSVVLDEADRMLDMGFINDIRRILRDIPSQRHTLCFSATMPPEIEKLVGDFLHDPVTVSVRTRDVTSTVSQDVVRYIPNEKFNTLTMLLAKPEFRRVIIFGERKHSVQRLARDLDRAGIKADAIHGNKTHQQRQRALNQFKSGAVQVLVATDVAARGIHVDDVSHVINYDLPATKEDYVHRIGRTGRANKKGQALTFVPST